MSEDVDAEIQVTTNGRTQTLDPDGILITHVADKDSQTIEVVASAEGYQTTTTVFDLTGLICDDGEDNQNQDDNQL